MTTPAELYTNPLAATTVSTGGTTAPVSGTTESWTMAGAYAAWPQVSSTAPGTQLHLIDPAATSEIILVTNMSGTTWSVTRGAEGTTPVVHAAGFTVVQVISASVMTFGQRGQYTHTTATQAFTLASAVAITGLAALLTPGTWDIECDLAWNPSGTIGSQHQHGWAFTGTTSSYQFNMAACWQSEATSTASDQRSNFNAGTTTWPVVRVQPPNATCTGLLPCTTGRVVVTGTGVLTPTITLLTASNGITTTAGCRMVATRIA